MPSESVEVERSEVLWFRLGGQVSVCSTSWTSLRVDGRGDVSHRLRSGLSAWSSLLGERCPLHSPWTP